MRQIGQKSTLEGSGKDKGATRKAGAKRPFCVAPPLVLETAGDREHALQQIGGTGNRWLEHGQLSQLFASMQDGFDRHRVKTGVVGTG